MTVGLTLIVAHAGHFLAAVPVVMPAFLVVGTVAAMRIVENRRENPSDE